MQIRKVASVIHSSKFHLEQVRESYPQHFRAALGIAIRLAVASGACALHALVPGLCTRSASRRIAQIHATLSRRSDVVDQHRPEATALRPRPPLHVKIEDS